MWKRRTLNKKPENVYCDQKVSSMEEYKLLMDSPCHSTTGDDLEPYLVVRILEVLQSAFRSGHIQVADYTSFHVTLLSQFQVYPEKVCPAMKYDGKSNWRTFKYVTSLVCSCLSQIGDDYLVFQIVEKIIVDQICGEIPMDNKCAFLRLLITLDSKPTRFSDRSIVKISHVLPKYLIDVVSNVGEDDQESTSVISVKRRRYYLLPSFYLFNGSKRLLNLVLNVMGSWISEVSSSLGSHHIHPLVDRSTMVCAISSVLFHMFKDVKIRQILLSCKIETETMLQNLLNLLSSEGTNLTLEERHKIQRAYDRLRAMTNNEVLSLLHVPIPVWQSIIKERKEIVKQEKIEGDAIKDQRLLQVLSFSRTGISRPSPFPSNLFGAVSEKLTEEPEITVTYKRKNSKQEGEIESGSNSKASKKHDYEDKLTKLEQAKCSKVLNKKRIMPSYIWRLVSLIFYGGHVQHVGSSMLLGLKVMKRFTRHFTRITPMGYLSSLLNVSSLYSNVSMFAVRKLSSPDSKGWRSERIIDALERGRIILVQDGDPPAQQNKYRIVNSFIFDEQIWFTFYILERFNGKSSEIAGSGFCAHNGNGAWGWVDT
ncbi:hypothetical protein Pfo_028400 [Paulownia fortunei]|nr:hypothetical protein Pfo_028400 [Paulownia fortunei]